MSARLALGLAAAVCAVLSAACVIPMAAGVLHAGRLPDLSLAQSAIGSGRVVAQGRWRDPAVAYPWRARRDLPSAPGFAVAGGLFVVVAGSAAVAVGRRVEVRVSRSRLARAWFEVTGTSPRSWARPRDLRALWVGAPTRGRLTLGTIGRRRRLQAAEHETHIAVIAPTGSGKSSRFIIPWVLEAEGPTVVCSTKLDVVDATIGHRARLGRVFVWDPFGPRSAGWSPLAGCETWGGALRRARWMGSAIGDNGHAGARFWNGEAAKLLAPLLHAAALTADGSMAQVVGWLDRPEECCIDVPELLERHGATDAADQLGAVIGLDDRNRGTTFMSAAHLVEAYRYPEVQACDRREITPQRLLDGAANTLYIVASEDEQEMLAPLVVAMLAEIFSFAQREHRLHGHRLDRVLRVLLDETANIAPIDRLPQYLSGVRGAKVRIVTVWQDLAQLRTRYRDATGTILSNSQVKLFLGPVTDDDTRRYLEGALGDERVNTRTQTEGERSSVSTGETWRARASAQALQQLGDGRAVLVHTDLPVAVIDTTAWFASRRLRAISRREAGLVDISNLSNRTCGQWSHFPRTSNAPESEQSADR
jgi:type IV secretory pathway TraG/TraD family ATPase VirD4